MAALPWYPSTYWDGNDGLWNTFIVSVGSQNQQFRILPSTAGQETWVPNPDGCTTADPSDPGYCGFLRGTLPLAGTNTSGFLSNQSSTWDLLGLYTLDAQEAQLGYGGNGLYGLDTVTLVNTSTEYTDTRQAKQVVASVPGTDFWLGVFGLGPKAINFTNFNDPIESYMSDLVGNHTIPSLSWGYTAGQYYRDKAPASLTLGGYDTARFTPTNITFAMNEDNSRPLQVGIQKIIAENTLGGPGTNLLPTATYHFIDSTLPFIWLPDDAIQAFVDNFGLKYDNTTDLFLINDTMRQLMLSNKPTVTFFLSNTTSAAGDSSLTTQTIELPYAAFDLQASYPYYQNATNYFPIRRANGSAQYTLGRTFLQEAYLIADFERGNFTVAGADSTVDGFTDLVAITKPVATNATSSSTPSHTGLPAPLSGGAIGGIVVGAIAGITLVVLGIWFFVRRNKRKHQPVPTSDPEKPDDDYADDKKTGLFRTYELPSENALAEAPGAPKRPSELPSPPANAEMEGDLGKPRARPGMHEMPTPPMKHGSGSLAEAPGSDGRRYELVGSEPADRLRPY